MTWPARIQRVEFTLLINNVVSIPHEFKCTPFIVQVYVLVADHAILVDDARIVVREKTVDIGIGLGMTHEYRGHTFIAVIMGDGDE